MGLEGWGGFRGKEHPRKGKVEVPKACLEGRKQQFAGTQGLPRRMMEEKPGEGERNALGYM